MGSFSSSLFILLHSTSRRRERGMAWGFMGSSSLLCCINPSRQEGGEVWEKGGGAWFHSIP